MAEKLKFLDGQDEIRIDTNQDEVQPVRIEGPGGQLIQRAPDSVLARALKGLAQRRAAQSQPARTPGIPPESVQTPDRSQSFAPFEDSAPITDLKFDKALANTLGYEGAGVDRNVVGDSGISQLGVTQKAWDAYADKIRVPRKPVTKLSDKERRQFYKDEYAKPLNLDNLPDDVAMVAFDYGVNAGPGRAARDLQTVLGVKADGAIGPKTLAAIKSQNPKALAEKLLAMQESHYARLVKSDPAKYGKFQAGWQNRINAQRQKLALGDFGRKVREAIAVEEAHPELKFPEDVDLKIKFNPWVSQTLAGLDRMNAQLARIPAYAYNFFAILPNRAAVALGMPEQQVQAPDWLVDNPVATYYDRSAELHDKSDERFGSVTEIDENGVRSQRPTNLSDIIEAGEASEAAAYIGWKVLENAPQQVMLLGFAQARLADLGLGLMGAMSAAAKSAENQKKNLDPITATVNATLNGMIEVATEKMLGTPKVFSDIKEQLIKKFGMAGSKIIMKEAAMIFIKGASEEGIEEVAASFAQDIADWAMGVNPNALKGIVGRAFEAGVIGAASGATMTAPAATVSAYGDIRQIGADRVEARISALEQDGERYKTGQSEDGSISWHMNPDGSVNVKGPIEKVRILTEAAGINVKGIPNREGVKFSSAVGNKVIAALRGEKPMRHSRAGEVTEHELWESGEKKGTIKGAPEPYNTKRKLPALRKILKDSALEGVSGRFWYENSGRAIMALVGGDKEAASKFAKVVAAYSPSTSVAPNMTNALKAWFQWLNNEPIKAGRFGAQDRNVSDILYKNAEWEGEKTNNFYINLMRVIDPENFTENQGVTNDMWMMRMFGYPTDAPTAQAYRFVENETNRLAKELGWEPQQIQAAIWTAIKTRAEDKTVKDKTDAQSERAGDMTWVKSDKGQEVRKFKDDAAEARHRERWFNNAVQLKITPEQIAAKKFDFADAMMAHRAQVSWESRPGRSTGVLPELNDAPMFQQMEFHEAISKALKDENGVDILARELGMPMLSDYMGVGMWEGQASPGTQAEALLPPRHKPTKDDAHQLTQGVKDVVTAYAATLGRLLYQEGVGWHRPFYATTRKEAAGTEINVGHTLLENEMRALYTTLSQLAQAKGLSINDFGFIASRNGVRILNFTGQDNVMIQDMIMEAAEKSLEEDFRRDVFAYDGGLISNDWKAAPNGEMYRDQISNERLRASSARAADLLAPKIRAVHEDFARRYGWSNPANTRSEARYKVSSPLLDALDKDRKRAAFLKKRIEKSGDVEQVLDAQKELQETEDRIRENEQALQDHFDKMVSFGKDIKFSRPGTDDLGNELGYEEEKRRNEEGLAFIREFLPEIAGLVEQPAALTTDQGMALLGDYLRGRIRAKSGQPLSVYKHEGFHAFFDLFVSPKDKIRLLDAIQREYPDRVQTYADKYGVSQDRAAEEVMAELMETIDNKRFTYDGKSIPEQIVTFLQQVIEKMKIFFGIDKAIIQDMADAFYEMRRSPSQARQVEERNLYAGVRAQGFEDVPEEDRFWAPDKKLRFEIPDKDADLTFKGEVEALAKEAQRIRADGKIPIWDRSKMFEPFRKMLEDVIKSKRTLGAMLDHPELYKRYPWAKDVPVLVKKLARGTAGQAHNSYSTLSPEGSHIRISSGFLDNMASLYSNSQMQSYEDFRNTLLHEVQHMIQAYENFAQGGSVSKYGFLNYVRLLGEVESRDVEARSRMTEEQRRALKAYESQVDPVEAATRENWKRKIRGLEDVVIRQTGQVDFETPRIYGPGQSRAAQIAKYFFKKTPSGLPTKPVTVYAIRVADGANAGKDFSTFPSIQIAGETFESKSAALAALKNLDIRMDERKKRYLKDYGDAGQKQEEIKGYVIQETHRTDEKPGLQYDPATDKWVPSEYFEETRVIDRKIVATEEDAAKFDETKILEELQRRMVGEKKKAIKSESSESSMASDQTNTPAFKKWFGDSKVVDESGKPMVMYHGTDATFHEFAGGRGDMMFFSDQDTAEGFGSTLMPVYIKSVKPFSGDRDSGKIKEYAESNFKKIKKEINSAASETDPSLKVKTIEDLIDRIEGLDYFVFEESQTLRAGIRAAGYDSIVSDEMGAVTYGVFDPAQIKSINNVGTFDQSNPDIRYKIDERDSDILKDIDQKLKFGGYTQDQIKTEYAERGIDIQFKGEAIRVSPSKVKGMIREVTGQVKDEEIKDLKDKFREQSKGARFGYRQGVTDAREKLTALMREKLEKQAERFEERRRSELETISQREQDARESREMKAEERLAKAEARAKAKLEAERADAEAEAEAVQSIKEAIVDYALEQLPKAERGTLLTVVRDAKTLNDAMEAGKKIDQILEQSQKKGAIGRIRSLVGQAMDSGRMAVEYKDIVKKLVSGVELKGHREETLKDLQKTKDFIEAELKAGRDVDIPNRIYRALQILERKPASELELSELEAIITKIELVIKLGKLRLASREAQYEADKVAKIKELASGRVRPIRSKEGARDARLSMLDNLIQQAKDRNDQVKLKKYQAEQTKLMKQKAFRVEARGWLEGIRDYFDKNVANSQILDKARQPMDHFFQTIGDQYHRVFKAPLDLLYGNYTQELQALTDRTAKILKELKLDQTNFRRIGIFAANEQENGREKLLKSGITEAQIDAIKLTPEEKRFYDFMQNEMETVYPRYKDVIQNVYNAPVGKVTKYFPFMTDYTEMSELEVRQRLMENPEFQTQPKKNVDLSASKTRVDRRGNVAVRIDANEVFMKHMQSVLYAVHMAKEIKMLQEIAKSPKFASAAGDVAQIMTVEWLDLMARNGGIAGQDPMPFLDFIRKNTSLAMLSLNPTSIAIQSTAIIDAAGFIGRYAFTGQMMQGSREWRDFAMNNSPELRNRVGDDQAYREFSDAWYDKLRSAAMTPQKILDGTVATGVFLGAYQKFMDEKGVKADPSKPDRAGIEYANRMVRMSQASALFKDLPLFISKGLGTNWASLIGKKGKDNRSWGKAWSQFQTPLFYRYANLRDVAVTKAMEGKWKEAANIIGSQILAVASEVALRHGVKGLTALAVLGMLGMSGDDDDEDKQFGDYLNEFFATFVGNVPFISNAMSLFAYKQAPVASLAIAGRTLEDLKNFQMAKKPETKRKWAAILALDLAAIATGAPTPRLTYVIKKATAKPKKKALFL